LSSAYFLNNTVVVSTDRSLTNVANIVSTGTGFFKIPSGNTAQRPGSAEAGMFRYNTTDNKFEGYSDSWKAVGGATAEGGLTHSPRHIIYKIKNATQIITTNTFTSITDLESNITPLSSTSKIRITASLNVVYFTGVEQNFVTQVGLFRGDTMISSKTQYVRQVTSHGSSSLGGYLDFVYIDTPGSTQTVNYNLKFRTFSNGNSVEGIINSDVVYVGSPIRSTMIIEDYTY
jgi:hypothetical protein